MTKRVLELLIIAIFICGCARVRHPVPPDLINRAQVLGAPDIRAFSNRPSDIFINDLIKLLDQEESGLFSFLDFKAEKSYAALAISGGAANGAYGAGLLCGWTQAKTRPD